MLIGKVMKIFSGIVLVLLYKLSTIDLDLFLIDFIDNSSGSISPYLT